MDIYTEWVICKTGRRMNKEQITLDVDNNAEDHLYEMLRCCAPYTICSIIVIVIVANRTNEERMKSEQNMRTNIQAQIANNSNNQSPYETSDRTD